MGDVNQEGSGLVCQLIIQASQIRHDLNYTGTMLVNIPQRARYCQFPFELSRQSAKENFRLQIWKRKAAMRQKGFLDVIDDKDLLIRKDLSDSQRVVMQLLAESIQPVIDGLTSQYQTERDKCLRNVLFPGLLKRISGKLHYQTRMFCHLAVFPPYSEALCQACLF